MIAFDAAHKAVHYPPDRRVRIWLKPSFIVVPICLHACCAGAGVGPGGGLWIALSRTRT